MKTEALRKKLLSAEGRSEFVIAVVCDIRGFSVFSTHHESPDTAMFIKRFYLQLLEKYFSKAVFVKLTGDGMLMTFRYSEKTLFQVSQYVFSSCFSAISDFPNMFEDDPMINFTTPQNIGFGISRGPACCLYSGKDTLDYSGHVLNLSARLNDIARPRGIVIDGHYLIQSIPDEFKDRFKEEHVYLKSIAEENSRLVFVSDEVQVPAYARFPLSTDKWEEQKYEMTVSQLNKLSGNFVLPLNKEPKTPEKIKVDFVWPNPKVKGFTLSREYQNIEYYCDASGPKIKYAIQQAKNIVTEQNLSAKTKVHFYIQLVAKV
ncbi:hypothetical protein GURASL_34880 [Geotalea uraniireducens]|uniref:Guanylate cyclase domain-containing protein n=1 Tax=Geotalea uraniireducens TaxID=351604 RepID=A0ABM8EQ30_9BACT|nr:hypothetical protein [Geotalea uraniireducens]BDV44565.1 hypothetical protein GURASL_34880 [Geotalea uraniireducens]